MWVAVAVVGGAVIGGVASNMAADTAADAARDAANLQASTANTELGLRRDIYNRQLSDFRPYLQAGTGALSQLSSLSGVRDVPLAREQIEAARQKMIDAIPKPNIPPGMIAGDRQLAVVGPIAEQVAAGDDQYNKRIAEIRAMSDDDIIREANLTPGSTGIDKISTDKEYQDYLSELKSLSDPTRYLTDSKAVFENPIYQFQRDEATKGLSRKLRSLGRENSTYGLDAFGKQNNQLALDTTNQLIGLDNSRFGRLSGLAATRYNTLQDYYNRLRDLAGSGQAAAGMTSNAGANYAAGAGATLSNLSTNQGNAMLAGGAIKAGATQNLVNNGLSLANLGLKYYNANQQPNSGGLYDSSSFDYTPADTSFLDSYQNGGEW